MKNRSFFPTLFALACMVFLLENCKDKCDKDASIDAVQPDNNPAGYEILLKTNGFSDNAKVVFGNLEATSRAGGESGGIIATVPNGLSGNVEISVEEGDCIKRSDFVVLGGLPTNVQPSLPEIIIPVPAPFSQNGLTNNWINAADPTGFTYGIRFEGSLIGGVFTISDTLSFEFHFGDPKFNHNLVTGTINNNTNVIYLEIDRTPKGSIVEHFDGQFIEKPDFITASSKPAMLLVSRETGRQLLLYHPG